MISPSNAGQFRWRVTLLSREANKTNELGETVTQDPTPIGERWASISPLNGKELINAAQNYQEVTHEVRLRYDSALTHADSIEFKNRRLDIVSIINIEEQNIELLLLCKEVQ